MLKNLINVSFICWNYAFISISYIRDSSSQGWYPCPIYLNPNFS